MPVYNGEEYIEAALRSLLAQDHGNLEIVISDNGSTDRTQEICRRLAEQHPQIRYSRNPQDIGPMLNFVKAVELATGEYFMWAAHDDLWSPNYISALLAELEANPRAVLSTPRTVHIHPDGSPTHHEDDNPAPGSSPLRTMRMYFRENCLGWFYGLYRSAWLKEHVAEWFQEDYPLWGFDMMWMVSNILRFPIVGSADAVFLKRFFVNSCAPKADADKLRFGLVMLTRLTQICRRYSPSPVVRTGALLLSWRYAYHRHIRRGNPLKTLWRLARLPAAALQVRAEMRERRAARMAAEAAAAQASSDRRECQQTKAA
jgi:glycosyltransferase involved in cell wall biosynthesis